MNASMTMLLREGEDSVAEEEGNMDVDLFHRISPSVKIIQVVNQGIPALVLSHSKCFRIRMS